MGLAIEGSAFCVIVAILFTLGSSVVLFFKWRFGYWNRQRVKSLPTQIPFGNMKDMLLGKKSFATHFKDIHDDLRKAGLKFGGIFMLQTPHFIPVDPGLIKNMLHRDFPHFFDRGIYTDEKNDPLTGNLAHLEGSKWKYMRTKLTPAFTSGMMKMMFQTLVDCTSALQETLDKVSSIGDDVDIKDILARFTMDVIGSCAFGFECNSLKNPDSEFMYYGKRFFTNTPLERLRSLAELVVPLNVLRWIGFKKVKVDVEEFFMGAIRSTVEHRERNNVFRNDFMHLLLQLKNRGRVADDEKFTVESGKSVQGKTLTINELAAQCFVFFMAGFETSSTTMTFALYELAVNPDIQAKLRTEVRTVLEKHGDHMTYEAIHEMCYLDQVFSETLRKYPPAPILRRQCTKDYPIPESPVVVRKGTLVDISIYGIHHDPEYYPDPEKFDPERFCERRKQERPACTWIPFGEGPRMCIGFRFGIMQTKVGLAAILRNYSVRLSDRTRTPIQFENSSFILSTEGGIWLNVEKIS